ncbi:MAG: alpha/beta fold hydrolase [Anaerolineales bacterium]|nr:alpha/beta fold hydrolase [Anaerolineales bacterium]
MKDWFKRRPKLSIFLAVVGGIILLLGILALRPISLQQTFTPDPAASYEEAVSRIEAIRNEEAQIPGIEETCETQAQVHGEKRETVVVFLHGFTSCPDQFKDLGKEYFDLGYNVYIPRQPRHGLEDHTGDPLKGLSAEELAQFGTDAADIAQGLGDRVIVAGLSGGGTVATWLAQERSDIDLAVPISPFLGIGFIPKPLTRPLTNLILLVPDFHQWWDPVHGINNPLSASYSYRGYWTHALFENIRLGFVTAADASEMKPMAGSILVVTNDNDSSVNNAVTAGFVEAWQEHGEEFLDTYQFPKDFELPHDLITFTRPDSQPEVVYPQLLELIR